MRAALAIVSVALFALAGCSTAGPDYDALLEQTEEAGQAVRECERAPRSADCRFAIRDGADTMTEVWRELDAAELAETEEAQTVNGVGYDWHRWRIRCDVETPNEHAYWCVMNAPAESDVGSALAALRGLRDA